jgi:hypothetical protein
LENQSTESSNSSCEECQEEDEGGLVEPIRFLISDEKTKQIAKKLGPEFTKLLGIPNLDK